MAACSPAPTPRDQADTGADAAAAALADHSVDDGGAGSNTANTADAPEANPDGTRRQATEDTKGKLQPNPPAVVDSGPPVTFANGCAIPQPLTPSKGCAGKACPPQTLCMGDGLCLPDAPFPLATGEVHVTKVDLAAAGTEWAAVYDVSTSYAEGFDHRLAVKFFVGADTVGSKPLVVWETNASGATWPHVHALGGGQWLVGWTAYAWNAFTTTLRVRRISSAGGMGPVFQIGQPGMAQSWGGNMLKPQSL